MGHRRARSARSGSVRAGGARCSGRGQREASGSRCRPIIRWLLGWDWYSRPVTFTTVLFLMPIGFILGIGCFDYWARYIIGSPTRPENHDDHGAYRWQDYFKVNTDHKVIGIQYLVTTFAFFLIGGLCAEAFRTELAKPGLQFMTADQYNGLISVHAALMIFLFIIPAFAGLANFVIPLMLGADDMAFPRLNALSFWMLPTAGVMMVASLFWQGFGAGWTAYAPLASDYQTVSQLFFNIGVQFAGTSSILTAVNFIVTILTMRAPGMTLWRMPLLVWANLTTSALVVLGTPFVAGSQFMLLFDHVMHTDFFNYQGRRCRAAVPARLLVLLTPGRLHHDAARVRDRLRGHLGDGAQADLRLPRRRVLDDLDRRARLHGVGAPHVRRRAYRRGCASRS